MKKYRLTHKLTGEARKKANARAYLHVYVKRGKVKKTRCEVCNKKRVEAHHADYDKPLEVRWLCHRHHLELIKAEPRTWEGATYL